ncbi:hypothetical protein SAY87_022425 [Trapa incisa]|uniref:Phytocyanin domain-containing protein n=1 Tax=Trapa incisa TaxID=236973 RepID=A0AAN7K457_9MYRT|nr:hypothetical protein SAY87_022425 [Trapa incisa]
MEEGRNMLVVALVVCVLMAVASSVGAQVHHVVGGDVGWDPTSDITSWSASKIFRVGDKIWFAYSAAQESIVELRSKEEYESCDVTNPIRMYTDGIDGISLEEEGTRYFVSNQAESCMRGLRLHVVVQPQEKQRPIRFVQIATSEDAGLAAAAGPTVPSGSCSLTGASPWLAISSFIGIVFPMDSVPPWVCLMVEYVLVHAIEVREWAYRMLVATLHSTSLLRDCRTKKSLLRSQLDSDLAALPLSSENGSETDNETVESSLRPRRGVSYAHLNRRPIAISVHHALPPRLPEIAARHLSFYALEPPD